MSETSRDIAFCSKAIEQAKVFVVRTPCRMNDSGIIRCEPRIRFYAGAPLITEGGYALGTLCVIDRKPRQFNSEQTEALKALSRLTMTQLEFRRNLALLKEALNGRTREEHEREAELRSLQGQLERVIGVKI